MTAPLRALPPERRGTMLGSILTPLLAPTAADRPDGVRTVTLPARPPAPPGASLAGTESVSHASNGTVTIRVEASSAAAAAPASPDGASSAGLTRMSSTSVRNIDPATGLLEDARDTSDVSVTTPAGVRRVVTETVTTLRLAS
jgi:hypothetical protein